MYFTITQYTIHQEPKYCIIGNFHVQSIVAKIGNGCHKYVGSNQVRQ